MTAAERLLIEQQLYARAAAHHAIAQAAREKLLRNVRITVEPCGCCTPALTDSEGEG